MFSKIFCNKLSKGNDNLSKRKKISNDVLTIRVGKIVTTVYVLVNITYYIFLKQKVREQSRECHNEHEKTQPFPNTKRSRKPTNSNKHKSNKRTKSANISSLFPKRGNRNAKRKKNTRTKRLLNTIPYAHYTTFDDAIICFKIL